MFEYHDSHVQVCLYFISPTEHSLKSLVLKCIYFTLRTYCIWNFSHVILPHPPLPPQALLSLPYPLNCPQCVMLLSLSPCVLIVQHTPMSENIWCLAFCCVSLLRMMVSRFIQVPTKDTKSSFLWLHSIPLCICATFSLSSLSLMGI